MSITQVQLIRNASDAIVRGEDYITVQNNLISSIENIKGRSLNKDIIVTIKTKLRYLVFMRDANCFIPGMKVSKYKQRKKSKNEQTESKIKTYSRNQQGCIAHDTNTKSSVLQKPTISNIVAQQVPPLTMFEVNLEPDDQQTFALNKPVDQQTFALNKPVDQQTFALNKPVDQQLPIERLSAIADERRFSNRNVERTASEYLQQMAILQFIPNVRSTIQKTTEITLSEMLSTNSSDMILEEPLSKKINHSCPFKFNYQTGICGCASNIMKNLYEVFDDRI